MGHNLTGGRQSAQLETFSGTLTISQPHDTPEGGSPRNQNCDFSIGSVFTRQGLKNPFTYSGNSLGPLPGGAAIDVSTGGSAWTDPGNVLIPGEFASVNVGPSDYNVSSSTSAGLSVGGGVIWTDPENIDSSVSFASVSLSSGGGGGGTTYYPSQSSGSIFFNANSSNTNPPNSYQGPFGELPSVGASTCTLYVDVSAAISFASGGGAFAVNASYDGGVTWRVIYSNSISFGPTTIPITVTGITNINTILLQLECGGGCSPSGYVSIQGYLNNWYVVVSGGTPESALTAETLQAAISGLVISPNSTITGLEISFQADYSGIAPTVQASLNVGSAEPSFSLTTSPATYTFGGDGNLWGYSGWTQDTLTDLIVNFYVSATDTSTINVNELVVTVFFTTVNYSDALDVQQFGISIPSTYTPQGIIINTNVYAAAANASLIEVQLLKAGVPVGDIQSIVVTETPTPVTFGNINYLFGSSWTYSDFNSTEFGIRFSVSDPSNYNTTVYLGYTTLQVYFTPLSANFNYVTTYEDDYGNIKTLALDEQGNWWIEDVTNNPNVLSPLFSNVPEDSFANSFTADSRQYIATSNLTQGNYPPIQVIGSSAGQPGWQDRVSQVGPGAPPSFIGTLSAGNTVNITAYSYSSDILTLTGSNDLTAGEIITIQATSTDPLYAINGQKFNVLGIGLTTSSFSIATSVISGSGSTTAQAISQYTYPIEASPSGITQFPFWNEAQGYQSQLDGVFQSSGPGPGSEAGNVITVYYLRALQYPNGFDPNLVNAYNAGLFPVYVYVSGSAIAAANGTHLVTGVGIATPPGATGQRYYFTFNVASSAFAVSGASTNGAPGQYQVTYATVNTTLPLPGVQTGDSVTLSGNGVTQWNQTFTIIDALNSGSYSISQTSMANGVASYNWALSGATSTPPLIGQLVTISGTESNQGGNIYNVTDAFISNVIGGVFYVSGFANNLNYSTEAQVGQATTSGNSFQIDPGPAALGLTAVNPIYGDSGGGYITLVGSSSVIVGIGTRKGTVFFITRNGYWTAPAPPVQFDTAENTNYVLVSNIPIGPPDVIGRGIAFTEAGQNGQPGANFFTIPTPVSFVYNGQTYLSSGLIIWDNVTTNAKFTFPDSVLLSAEAIDVPGNNLFELGELGDAAWCTQYEGRSVWGRVNNKIQNFVNLSFDGGYTPNPGSNLLPLGWTLDSNYSPVGSQPTLLVSPVFGNSYYIKNETITSYPILGMITQSAYQDWENVAILQNQTPYSVRVTCRTPSGTNIGSLVVDLATYNSTSGYGNPLGSFTLDTSEMTSNMESYTGTLLTANNLTIPSSLLLRVYAANLAPNKDIEIDRIEVFPTLAPINLTGLSISYKDDLESIDLVTGGNNTSTLNSQPANGAFEIHNQLYIVKEKSLGYLNDTPNQEPSNWNPYKEVSNIAGACGINAYDVGEEWAIMACQNGLYAFNGGAPMPIHLEIPDIWQAINWQAGETICLRNDSNNKRILIAVPMTTPNQWCPDFPVNNNPTAPNVILYLNYDGIGSIEELIAGMSEHVNIMGKIMVHDMKRKWSIWSITTPYMAICKRNELTEEMLICNGIESSKIYALGSYTTGEDDGTDFTSSYCTYGFVDQQKAKENPAFGMHQKRYTYWTSTVSGQNGPTPASLTFYQNSLQAPYPFVDPGGLILSDPATEDQECPLDELGVRLFIEIKTTGGYFNMSRQTLTARMDSWNPIRGV